MKYLNVPVPKTVTATYVVPLASPMTEAEARDWITSAVRKWLRSPLREVVSERLARVPLKIKLFGALPDEMLALPEGTDSPAGFASIKATYRPTFIALHELRARSVAAAFAAELDVPVADVAASEVLTASQALASFPPTALANGPQPLASMALPLTAWVKIHDLTDRGRYWAWSAGMQRFGLPELRVGGCEQDLRDELRQSLLALVHRVGCEVFADPGITRNVDIPNPVKIPAEFMLGRQDLDNARGEPNRGGGNIEVALRLSENGNWLTVHRPQDPIYWESDWEHYIANLCHIMFAFEKPSWHYLPELGAAFKALESLPAARHRLTTGDLPPGARFLVRYQTEGQELRWAKADSWHEDTATVRDIGPELSPGARPGPSSTIAADLITDWAIWEDGRGVTEGAITETISDAGHPA